MFIRQKNSKSMLVIIIFLNFIICGFLTAGQNDNKQNAYAVYKQGLETEEEAKGDPTLMRQAMELYKESLLLDQNHEKADYCRGRILGYIEDNYEKAYQELLKAYERDKNDYMIIKSLGYATKNIEKYDESLGYFEILKQKMPDSSDAYSGRGSVFRDMGKYDEAIKEFKSAYEIFQGFGLLMQIGNCYYKKGDFIMASEYYKRLVEEYPNTGHYRMLGDAYLHSKQYENAIEAYKNSLCYDKNNAKAFFGLGMVYLEKGNYQLAVDWLGKCLNSEPDYKNAKKYLDLAKEELKTHGNSETMSSGRE